MLQKKEHPKTWALGERARPPPRKGNFFLVDFGGGEDNGEGGGLRGAKTDGPLIVCRVPSQFSHQRLSVALRAGSLIRCRITYW